MKVVFPLALPNVNTQAPPTAAGLFKERPFPIFPADPFLESSCALIFVLSSLCLLDYFELLRVCGYLSSSLLLILDWNFHLFSDRKIIIMKATCGDLQMSSAKHSENKILKSRSSTAKDVSHEEMQSLLAKLKDLVPNVPRNRKLSKLEIIQYVIDYILDLQIALETHPAVTARPASAASSLSAMSPCRQPLGVLPAGTNTCAAQEVTQMDKVVAAHLSDAISTTRPVSC